MQAAQPQNREVMLTALRLQHRTARATGDGFRFVRQSAKSSEKQTVHASRVAVQSGREHVVTWQWPAPSEEPEIFPRPARMRIRPAQNHEDACAEKFAMACDEAVKQDRSVTEFDLRDRNALLRTSSLVPEGLVCLSFFAAALSFCSLCSRPIAEWHAWRWSGVGHE